MRGGTGHGARGMGISFYSPRPPPPAPRPSDAFSLIELTISLGILAVGLVGAMRVFPIGLKASQRSEMSSRAAIVAQRTIESLKLESCDGMADGEAPVDGFTVRTRLSQPQALHLADPARVKMVETAVTWTQDGRSRTLTFVTYVRCHPS